MGVILLCVYMSKGQSLPSDISIPIWLMVVCSVVMAAGTAMGGKKIIKSVGMDMVKLEKYQGFSADIAAALSLLSGMWTCWFYHYKIIYDDICIKERRFKYGKRG